MDTYPYISPLRVANGSSISSLLRPSKMLDLKLEVLYSTPKQSETLFVQLQYCDIL
jgi:hypothetical protein